MTKQAALVITELHHPCQRTDLCFGWRLKLAWHRAQEIVLAKAWALQLLTQTPFATSWGKKGYRQFHLDCWSLPPVEALMQPYISGWAANPWKRANLLLQFDAKMPIDQAMSQMFHPTQNLTVAGVSTRKWAIRRGSSLSIYLEFYHPISLQFSANVHPSLTTISPIFRKYNFVFAICTMTTTDSIVALSSKWPLPNASVPNSRALAGDPQGGSTPPAGRSFCQQTFVLTISWCYIKNGDRSFARPPMIVDTCVF